MKSKALAIIIGAVTILSACGTKKNYQHTEGKIYGTFYHITYNYSDDLQKDLRAEMERVNASLSMFNPRSVIAKINRGESDSTDVLFREMFVKAAQINRETDGAFDITVAPLANAWGFGFKTDTFPSAAKIDSILQFVGMDKLTLEGDRLVKQVKGVELDASSIAKGLGADLVALATSGNYRNFYIHDGKKYAHTIHPGTGYPVQQDILSASVYTDSCMKADAYATAFMVLGLEAAKEIVNRNPALEACFIYEQDGTMQTWTSPGFEKLIDRK